MARGWVFKRGPDGLPVTCSFDDPDSQPDINRVLTELAWDPESESYT